MTILTANATNVIETLAANMTRKLTADDMNDNLRSAAGEYIFSYTGSFSYMTDLHYRIVGQAYDMTNAQAAGALNCAIADHRYNVGRANKAQAVKQAEQIITEAAPAVAAATEQAVPDGYYTLVGPNGGHRTIRLQTVEGESVKQWLSYLCGADNEGDYKSVGFVMGTSVRLFNKYEGQYKDIVLSAKHLIAGRERIGEYGTNYALRSGRCSRCNKRLTVPASIGGGYGPKCKAIMDI